MQLNQTYILKLREMLLQHDPAKVQRTFVTGLDALDAVAPHGAFARGAIHELLYEPGNYAAAYVAAILAKAATVSYQEKNPFVVPSSGGRFSEPGCPQPGLNFRQEPPGWGQPGSEMTFHNPILWCDPKRELYPPALLNMGISPDKLIVIHPRAADDIWATTEALRCNGLVAVVASPAKLSRVEARRLQLAAEEGGTVGILLRCLNKTAIHYAAATRWLIQPVPSVSSPTDLFQPMPFLARNSVGEETDSSVTQRWSIQLIHGHGGQIGKTIILERSRDIHTRFSSPAGNSVWDSITVEPSYPVRAFVAVADRPLATKTA